jgi:oligopeptide/dipeptide ABC transporter ATP-binding protein
MPATVFDQPAAEAEPEKRELVLDIRNLTVAFPTYGARSATVVRDIDLELRAGEVLGLVGESGSGKTMLARAIMRLIPSPGYIEHGSVRFGDQDVAKLGEEELRKMRGRDISMIISNPRGELDPLQTVGRQISDVLRAHLKLGRQDARRRALELLRQVSIPDPERRLDAYPHEMSGGMAQRVVMAIALACSPKLIISDDATSGLDVTVQSQVLELMRDLVIGRGTSMLFITRDLAITAHYCDRVAIIYAGEIVELADRLEFFDNPQHPYTVLLLAAFAHNDRLRHYWLGGEGSDRDVSPSAVGCPFSNRCVRAEDRCRSAHPELRELSRNHFVRCHFPVER